MLLTVTLRSWAQIRTVVGKVGHVITVMLVPLSKEQRFAGPVGLGTFKAPEHVGPPDACVCDGPPLAVMMAQPASPM